MLKDELCVGAVEGQLLVLISWELVRSSIRLVVCGPPLTGIGVGPVYIAISVWKLEFFAAKAILGSAVFCR